MNSLRQSGAVAGGLCALGTALCLSCVDTGGPLGPGDEVVESPEITEKQLMADSVYMRQKFAEAGYNPLGMPIDLGDPEQYKALENRLFYNGITPQSDPALFAQIAKDRASPEKAKSASADDRCGMIGGMSGDFNGTSASATIDYSCFDAGENISRAIADVLLTINGQPVAQEVQEWWPGEPVVTQLHVTADTSASAREKNTCAIPNTCYANCDAYYLSIVATTGEILYKYYACPSDTEEDGIGPVGDPQVSFIMDHPKKLAADSVPEEIGILMCMNRYWLGQGLLDCSYFIDVEPGNCGGDYCCPPDHLCHFPDHNDTTIVVEDPIMSATPADSGEAYVLLEGTSARYDATSPNDFVLYAVPSVQEPELLQANVWLTLNSSSPTNPGGGICIDDGGNTPVLANDCVWFEESSVSNYWYAKIGKKEDPMNPGTYISCVPKIASRYVGNDCSDYVFDTDLNISMHVRFFDDIGGGMVLPYYRNLVWRNELRATTEDEVIRFLWGCLEPGTEIQLADGRSRKIEDIAVGDVVIADEERGQLLSVTDIMAGHEAKPLIHVESDSGHQLNMTSNHPVPLLGGRIVAAEQLQVGDVIWTDSGASALVVVEERPYDGPVYNLQLGTDDERASLDESETTMFANGILVGDARMQGLLHLLADSGADKTPVVDKRLVQDHQSSLRRGLNRQRALNGATLIERSHAQGK